MNENMSSLREKRLLVALATYNEIENLPQLVSELLSTVPFSDILIVDDNSPDGTGVWAKNFGESEPRVKTIIRRDERGLGSAVITALRYAIERDYRRVVNMDADFSHSVADVPRLLERAENPRNDESDADVVIGSRYVPGGAVPDWPLKRKLMSRCVNLFSRISLGLPTRDNSGAFRCYRVDALRRLDFSNFVSTGYSFFEEMLYRLKDCGASFAEIPIVFVDRRRGSSKINRKEAFKAVWIMTRLGLLRLLSRRATRG